MAFLRLVVIQGVGLMKAIDRAVFALIVAVLRVLILSLD
jgi:hypothetical protein